MTKDPARVPLFFRDDFDHLSDAHMQHIYIFLGLGEFNREAFTRERAYTRFKASHQARMDARDEAERLRAQQERQAHP